MVTETFKTDNDTAAILADKDILAAHDGKKSQVIKQALKYYAANRGQRVPAQRKVVATAKNVRIVS